MRYLLFIIIMALLSACGRAEYQLPEESTTTRFLNDIWLSADGANLNLQMVPVDGTAGPVIITVGALTCFYQASLKDGAIAIDSEAFSDPNHSGCDFFTTATHYSLSRHTLVISHTSGSKTFEWAGAN